MTKVLLLTYGALLALLALTTGLAYVETGYSALNTALALSIAVAKTALVILVFMEIKHGSELAKIVAGVGFFWLGILLSLAMTDYLSRGWLATGQ